MRKEIILKKHECDPVQSNGIGYNGGWCSECGCLYRVDKNDQRKNKLLWKPIGTIPSKCQHERCFKSIDFEDAVLTRTSVKYCAECGTKFIPADDWHRTRKYTIVHPGPYSNRHILRERMRQRKEDRRVYLKNYRKCITSLEEELLDDSFQSRTIKSQVSTFLKRKTRIKRLKEFQVEWDSREVIDKIKKDIPRK